MEQPKRGKTKADSESEVTPKHIAISKRRSLPLRSTKKRKLPKRHRKEPVRYIVESAQFYFPTTLSRKRKKPSGENRESKHASARPRKRARKNEPADIDDLLARLNPEAVLVQFHQKHQGFAIPNNCNVAQLLEFAADHWRLTAANYELQDPTGCVLPPSQPVDPRTSRVYILVSKPRAILHRSQRSQPALSSSILESGTATATEVDEGGEAASEEPISHIAPIAAAPTAPPELPGVYVLGQGASQLTSHVAAGGDVLRCRITDTWHSQLYTDSTVVLSCRAEGTVATWQPAFAPPRALDGMAVSRACFLGPSTLLVLAHRLPVVDGRSPRPPGELYVWRTTDNAPPKRLLPWAAVTAVACGRTFAVAVTSDGKAYSWGEGTSGELGCGPGVTRQDEPALVPMPPSETVIDVDCGKEHTALLSASGKVWTFGSGAEGRLGLGHQESAWVPTVVSLLTGKHVFKIACGTAHTAAITLDGVLYTWGFGKFGCLGHCTQKNKAKPHAVEAIKHKRIVSVSCDAMHTAALTVDGDVFTFGFGMTPVQEASSYGGSVLAAVPKLALKGKGINKISSGSGLLVALATAPIIGGSLANPITIHL